MRMHLAAANGGRCTHFDHSYQLADGVPWVSAAHAPEPDPDATELGELASDCVTV